MKKAVLVMAYGGPDSLDDIEPYLLDIRGGRPTSPELIEEIRARYALIGGKSPLLEITRAQARALQSCLNELDPANQYLVYTGMRHWKPYIRETAAQMAAEGYTSALAFCMAPHASRMSSGAYLQKLREAENDLPISFHFIESWYDQPFLIQALTKKVRAAQEQFSPEARRSIHYLFSAHSLPSALRDQGDPYESQLQTTANLLAEELGLSAQQWSFGYQSAGASAVKWLGPSIEERLPELAGTGKKNVLITPVGFMADHVEILFDIDIEAQQIARENGVTLARSASLNASPDFIEGLANFLLERLAEGNGIRSEH